MYKITEKIAKFLVDNVRDPGFKRDSLNPFIQEHNNAIGVIDPMGCFGTDFEYIVEADMPIHDGVMHYNPDVEGFWLYKKSELLPAEGQIEIPQAAVDSNVEDQNQMLDVTDCGVRVPPSVDKLTCKSTIYIDKLLEWEPKLRECLRDNVVIPDELKAPK